MAAGADRPRGLISKLIRLVVTLFVLLFVLAAIARFTSRPVAPDAFYSHALPPDTQPGTLLRSEPFTRAIPAGAQGLRILYVTTRGSKPALASAVVVASSQGSAAARPIIAWAHGTTGIVPGCAPSATEKPFDNLPDIGALVREGWAHMR